ncbi:MAG TPA: sialidase family protein, partial [Actinomycetota bacterium]|nr:sialidase family protein [Actinomycetota bacterium]
MRRLLSLAIGALVCVVGSTTSFAGPGPVTKVETVSGGSPFSPDGCGVNTDLLDSEHDATLAVDPRNADHLVATWIQDNTLSSAIGTSVDGGRTWTKSLVPRLTRCTGSARWDYAFDPWVSIGPNGIAYMSSIVNGTGPIPSPNPLPEYGLAVSRSIDGGLTWDDAAFPFESATYGTILDKSAITADATRPGHAHVVTTMLPNVLLHARTTDRGETWSDARPIYSGKPGFASFGAEIVALPDGTLLNIFGEWPLNFFPAAVAQSEQLAAVGENEVLVMRSTDGGESWSAPSTVVTFPPWVARDAETGEATVAPWRVVRSDVGEDGTIWVVWDESIFGDSRIRLTRSTDGGMTWSDPVDVVAAEDAILKPTIAVSTDALVVTFYDFRNDTPQDGELTTDVWLRHSHDGGASWEETHLGGPFDLKKVRT